MLRFALIGLVAGAASACKPDIGNPPSLVDRPRVLAVRSTPAEAKPGDMAMLDTLIATPAGTATPDVSWTICMTPKPPAEGNAVSAACVAEADDGPVTADPVPVTVPAGAMGACTLFGPIAPPTPPGGTPIRARDPDTTGGFYLPVRAAARGAGAGGQDLLAFALVRVTCNLTNAPVEVAQMFNMTYTPNAAPTFAAVTVTAPGGTAGDALAAALSAAPVLTVHARDKVALRVEWPPEAAETFPVFDQRTRELVSQREALSVSWFLTAGELEHDRTGRDGTDPTTSTDNVWTVPDDAAAAAGGVVHFWVVLADSRGGSAFTAFDVLATP